MHLLPQHLVELRDPELVPTGVTPVRAVVLLLQQHGVHQTFVMTGERCSGTIRRESSSRICKRKVALQMHKH